MWTSCTWTLWWLWWATEAGLCPSFSRPHSSQLWEELTSLPTIDVDSLDSRPFWSSFPNRYFLFPEFGLSLILILARLIPVTFIEYVELNREKSSLIPLSKLLFHTVVFIDESLPLLLYSQIYVLRRKTALHPSRFSTSYLVSFGGGNLALYWNAGAR